jgi:hypothetical protein
VFLHTAREETCMASRSVDALRSVMAQCQAPVALTSEERRLVDASAERARNASAAASSELLRSMPGAFFFGRFAVPALLTSKQRLPRKPSHVCDLMHLCDTGGDVPSDAEPVSARWTLNDMVLECRPALAALVNHFEAALGSTNPYDGTKIGLLCQGPPGTGKSTLVAALAHRLGYNVATMDISDPACADAPARACRIHAGGEEQVHHLPG